MSFLVYLFKSNSKNISFACVLNGSNRKSEISSHLTIDLRSSKMSQALLFIISPSFSDNNINNYLSAVLTKL